jgi:all-trans-retinol 13,14-reductase
VDDVTVVGAGLGGLVAGALLAGRGYRVTVLEQHYLPGGCATAYRRRGYRFEVALHALDGMDNDDPKIVLLRELDLLDTLPLVHLDRSEFYRFCHPQLDIQVPADPVAAVELLSGLFPQSRRSLIRFFAVLAGIRRELSGLFLLSPYRRRIALAGLPVRHPELLRRWNTTVGRFLDELFDDELLKLVLVANTLYYHDDPRRMSLFWYALSQGSFFTGGVHFVRGGSSVLSQALVDRIHEHGGTVSLRRDVRQIEVHDGLALGVRYTATGPRKADDATLAARAIVVNAALPLAAGSLIDAPEFAAYRRRIATLTPSSSFLTLFLGLRTTPASLGHSTYSTILAGRGVRCIDDLPTEFRSSDWDAKGFEFVDYSQIDSGLAPPGKSVAVVSLVDYLSNWQDLSEEEYRMKKDAVARILIGKLDRLVPGLAAAVEHYEVGTPRTVERFTRNPGGCIYGFRQDVGQAVPFRPGPRSPIENLFFASAWTSPGGGFTGAMLAGMQTAGVVQRYLGSPRRSAGVSVPGLRSQAAVAGRP